MGKLRTGVLAARTPNPHPQPRGGGRQRAPSPVSAPAVRYSSSRRVAKDARTMPAEANSPPSSITGRQPKRVTRMLDTGPVGRAESPLGLLHSPVRWTLRALHLPALEDGSKGYGHSWFRDPEGSVWLRSQFGWDKPRRRCPVGDSGEGTCPGPEPPSPPLVRTQHPKQKEQTPLPLYLHSLGPRHGLPCSPGSPTPHSHPQLPGQVDSGAAPVPTGEFH